ncbi:MAG: serine protease [Bdellovibrionota bacterium]
MKKYHLYSLIILISAFSFSQAQATAIQAYNKIRPLIVQVKSSASSNSEKSSYGTGFVIDKSGIIMTNYHVVSESIWNPEKLKSYVVFENQSLEAKILNVDFVNDLALLKIDHQFPSQIKLAESLPDKGEEIFSLGLPEDLEWTVVKGIYNGLVKHGPLNSFYMSTPINSGMSGGPIVNSKNELVAVNESIRLASSQISFGVPLPDVKSLLAEKNSNALTSKQLYYDKLQEQLTLYQEKLTNIIQKSFKKEKKISKIAIPDLSENFKCWGDSETQQENFYRSETEYCSNEYSIRINDTLEEGGFDFQFSITNNYLLNQLSWQNLISSKSTLTLPEVVNSFNSEATLNYTPVKCIRENITHGNSPILITICYQKILQLKGLFDFYISFYKSLNKKTFISGQVKIGAFSRSNMKKIINLILDKKFEVSK